MPEDHPILPGRRYAEVALVLAAALAGSPVPEQIPPEEIVAVLVRGVRECGGLDGLRRLDERNRAVNRELSREPGLTPEQAAEKRVIWSGDPWFGRAAL